MLQFTKLFLCASALIGTLFLSHQTGLYTPFGCNLAKEAAGFGLDNDPYSDVGIDPPIEVVVPGCDTKFRPMAFNNAVSNVWYNLQAPLMRSATYSASVANPSGGRYGREHIYEVQLLTLFIGSIKNDAEPIWDFKDDFCDWVDLYLTAPFVDDDDDDDDDDDPHLSLIDRLRRCLPRDNNQYGPFMPWLEQTTNGIKASAWSGIAIRTPQKFNSYSADKKVSVMRATAGVKSYMSAKLVHDSWVQQSDCVRNEWDKWQNFYGNDDNVPQSAKDVDIAASYDVWMTNTIQQFNNGLDAGMHDMIDLWNQVYGQNNPVNVHLNYPNRLNLPPTTTITNQNLEAMWLAAGGPFAPFALLNSTLVIQ